MAVLVPFAALRPIPSSAARVAAVPYDVVTTDEARALASAEPLSFLHVSRAEVDLPPGTSPYSDEVYAKAVTNLLALRRDAPLIQEESRSLYELLQDKVIPLYYDRGPSGLSPEWVAMAKRSIMTLLPRYNSERMVGEYLNKFYAPASERGREFFADGYKVARELASWKRKVRTGWPQVLARAESS
jgi:hypothetical protein